MPKRILPLALLFAAPFALAQTTHHTATHTTAAAPATIKNVFWQPNNLIQGSPAFFTVELDRIPTRVTATWIGKTLTFFPKPDDHKVWYALAGDDLQTQPNDFDLKVTAVLPGGHLETSTKSITIAQANFKTADIDVAPQFVEPDDAGKRQIAHDEILKTRAYSHSAPRPLWSGNFLKPVEAAATPTFGESRLLNEEKTSLHTGTDFLAKEGTTVSVANSGTVVLATEMYYEGNCIIVDHGDKFFTVYMHLAKIDVKVGDKLKKGQPIGISGDTGRVTGPHLHFAARWNGAYLDPVALLALTLPKTEAAPAAHTAAHTTTRR